ncbi:MAG: acetylxylan esterase [Bryobacteraceae bacterium]
MIRHLLFVYLLTSLLGAQVPARDRRITYTPNTDTHYTMPAYRNLAEWQTRSAQIREQILTAAGLYPMPDKPPMRRLVYKTIEHDDYIVETMLLETLPGYFVGGNLYHPAGKKGPFPAVALPHGHFKNGRVENQVNVSTPALGINLARLGFIAFAWDMVGYNDTMQTPHDFSWPPKGSGAQGTRELLWSFTPLALQMWNAIRAVDFLESLPDVDRNRIAATGPSGGGTQTFLLSAIDPRIKVAIPVNMISASMQGGAECESAPNLRFETFNVEIAALIAPRPMLMISASGDWTKNTPREEYPAMQTIYELFNQPDNLELAHFDAPHNYNKASRETAYRFLAKHLLGRPDRGPIPEPATQAEPANDMLALRTRGMPAGALDYGQVFARWREMLAGVAPSRNRLAHALAIEWPLSPVAEVAGDEITLTRPNSGDRVSVVHVPGSGTPLVIVHPDGAEAAQALVPPGRDSYLVTVFETGKAIEPRNTSDRYFVGFNRTDDANRVQDILTALAWLKRPVTLECPGKAAIWCTFAAAAAPVDVTLDAPLAGFRGTDEDFLRDFYVPGIQRAGGLAAALTVLKDAAAAKPTGQQAAQQ